MTYQVLKVIFIAYKLLCKDREVYGEGEMI